MEKNKVKFSDLKESDRIKEIKGRFGGAESFLEKVNPDVQIHFSDFDKVVSESDYYPSINDLCITYGKNFAAKWLVPHINNLTLFTGAKNITEQQHEELAKIIAKEFEWLPINAVLNFFYCVKSCKFPRIDENISPIDAIASYMRQFFWRCKFPSIDENISPMAITSYMRQFFYRYNALHWFANSVFLIVGNQPKTKVYARIFGTKIKAEKALKERDERTGERLYPNCHIIERTIE